MKISTCSYAGWRPSYGVPVRVTLGRPRMPEPTGRETWLFVAELAPAGWYFKAGPERFAACYASQINRLAGDILAKLSWLTDEHGPIVLCCYERQVRGPQDCHRRAAAEFIEQRLGIEIPEMDGR